MAFGKYTEGDVVVGRNIDAVLSHSLGSFCDFGMNL